MMRSRLRSQDGASAIVVAISLLLLVGAGAIAVDLGSAWERKRDLVVDTDAGALGAARAAADTGCSAAEPAALDFMSVNLGETLTAADIDLTCNASLNVLQPNIVSVSLTEQAQQTLSPAIGATSLDVFSSSTAAFNGYATGLMRPIAVCNLDSQISGYLPPNTGTLPADLVISMGRTWTDPSCGGGSGNWGYLCFDDPGCSNGEIQTYMRDGHPRGVDLGTANGTNPHPYNPPAGGTDEDCFLTSGTNTDWCEIRSGQAFTDNTPEAAILDSLVNTSFSILVSDCIGQLDASNNCIAGSNSATFVHPYAIAYVTLNAWCSAKNNESQSNWHPSTAGYTNAQCFNAATGNNDLVLALTLHGFDFDGTARQFVNFEDAAVAICGVDNDTVAERCERPTP